MLIDRIGPIVNCQYRTASSAVVATSSNVTGVSIQGISSVLFLCEVLVAPTSDCTETSDGTLTFQIQYDSDGTSATGSDAVTSNATFTCTDAVYVFSTANAAGDIIVIEVDCDAKTFGNGAGYLFPYIHGDSVSVMHTVAIPVIGTKSLPIAQTIAAVRAND